MKEALSEVGNFKIGGRILKGKICGLLAIILVSKTL